MALVTNTQGFNFQTVAAGGTASLSLGTRTAGATLIVIIDAASANATSTPDITSVVDASHGNAAFTLDYHPANVTQNTNAVDRISVWRLSNITGGTTNLTVTVANNGSASTASFCDAVVFEITGLDNTSPLDSAVSAVNHSTIAQSTITLTAASALATGGEIVLAYCVDDVQDNKFTTTSIGWATTDPNAAATINGNGYGASHQIYSSIVTPAITFTGSGGSGTAWEYGVIVAYKPSGPNLPYVTANTTSGTGAAGAAISPSLSTLAVGNYVVLLVAQNSGTVSVPTPAGWTAVPSTANIQNPTGTTDDRAIAAFTKQITSTTETASLTTTGKYAWVMFEVAQTSGPRASSGNTGQVTSAGANPTINSGAGVLTNDMLISYVATMTTASTFTAGTGYAVVPAAAPGTTNVSSRAEIEMAGAGGATAAAFVNASTTLWSELVFAMAPSGTAFTKQATETATAADTVGRVFVGIRNDTSTVNVISDTPNRVQVLARNAVETALSSDTVSAVRAILRQTTETLTALDSAVRSLGMSRESNEAESIADSADRSAGYLRQTVDAALSSEAASAVRSLIRQAGEIAAALDSALRSLVLNRSGDETTITTDSPNRLYGAVRQALDATLSSDLVNRVLGLSRTADDTSTSADSPNRVLQLARQVLQAIAGGDVVSRAASYFRSGDENTTTGDSPNRVLQLLRQAAETVLTSDAVAAIKSGGSTAWTAAVSETATVADAVSRLFAGSRQDRDSTSAEDSPNRLYSALRAAFDTLTSTDAATRRLEALRGALEGSATIDSAQRGVGRFVEAAEAVLTGDAANRIRGVVISVQESVAVSAVTDRIGPLLRRLDELLHVTDAIHVLIGHRPVRAVVTIHPTVRATTAIGPTVTVSAIWAPTVTARGVIAPSVDVDTAIHPSVRAVVTLAST